MTTLSIGPTPAYHIQRVGKGPIQGATDQTAGRAKLREPGPSALTHKATTTTLCPPRGGPTKGGLLGGGTARPAVPAGSISAVQSQGSGSG